MTTRGSEYMTVKEVGKSIGFQVNLEPEAHGDPLSIPSFFRSET